MKHIVIVGGSYGGIGTAHRLLKQGLKSGDKFKITLIAPNTHHYWNMASPRAIIPELLSDEELFRPIAPGFSQYPKDQFKFIIGTAESIEFNDCNVSVGGASGVETVSYDYLILATGSHMPSHTPFKMLSSTEATKVALHDLQERVGKAKSITVAGAGVSGVEIAAELGETYKGRKEIMLVASGSTVLEHTPPSVTKVTMAGLQKLNVTVKSGTRISESVKLPNGRQQLTLSNGESMTTDLYIPAFGLIPNSFYIPAEYLNEKGFVMVDEFLKVKGLQNVWAIGDVADIEPPQYKVTETQSAHLAKNMLLMFANKPVLPYKIAAPFVGFSIGRGNGTGYWNTTRIPSFVITWARKTLFLDRLGPTMDGSHF